MVAPDEPEMTGFVFKIQANMDPNHRDRIAFVRVCSGKLTRGMKAKLVRTGKPISVAGAAVLLRPGPRHRRRGLRRRHRRHPQSRHAADRRYADRRRARCHFRGVPSFAPEILRRVRVEDAMKAKKLREALRQMAEEGVVQVFLPVDGSPPIVGVVGALQLDVLKERLAAEYNLPIDFETTRFQVCRWVEGADPATSKNFAAEPSRRHGGGSRRRAGLHGAVGLHAEATSRDRAPGHRLHRHQGLPAARRS